jgi:predicted signal transduction protein with EAL and GGDEF domain
MAMSCNGGSTTILASSPQCMRSTTPRSKSKEARELDIGVVAEGVETEAQANFLVAAGCRQAQGFLFSRPVDLSRATELLRYGRIKSAPAMIKALGSRVA